MVKVQPGQYPSSAPAPPRGVPGSSGWLGAPTGETGPLGAQPLPRVLELAASEPADFPALTAQALNSTGKWCHVVDEATNVVFDSNVAKVHGTEATYSCADTAVKVEEALACPGHPAMHGERARRLTLALA